MSVRSPLVVLQVAFLLAVCIFLFFFGIGAFGLVGADEPRYAQIAREMFARHDWILPTLNGSPWLEKPALLYWKIINSYIVFGLHDWAARIPSAFHATALVVTVFFFMRRFRPGSEMDAALITASSAAIIGFARGASTDMSLAADFGVAMLAWWAWHVTSRKLWLGFFFALLAAGALAKGPVAPALALLIVGGSAWLRRDGKILLRSLWIPGFLLFFAIALPWYIAIQIKVPQFFRVFFLEHNLERFGTNLYQHSQPFWYYIPVFLLATVPWTVFTIPALVEGVREGIAGFRDPRAQSKQLEEPPPTDQSFREDDGLPVFLALWTLIPIIFFSISRSKLPGYILPGIPAAALLTADYLRKREKIRRIQLILHSLLCGLLMAAVFLTAWAVLLPEQSHCGFRCGVGVLSQAVPDQSKAWIAVIAGIVAVLVLVIVGRGGRRVLHFATMLPVVLALAFILRWAGPFIELALSSRAVAAELHQLGIGPQVPLAVFHVKREVAYGLNFYRNQPVSYYESGVVPDLPSGIPPQEHVVVAREGSLAQIESRVAPRQVTRLGDLSPQHLEFFLVSNSR